MSLLTDRNIIAGEAPKSNENGQNSVLFKILQLNNNSRKKTNTDSLQNMQTTLQGKQWISTNHKQLGQFSLNYVGCSLYINFNENIISVGEHGGYYV